MKLVYATAIDSITPPAPPEGISVIGERYVGVPGLIEELELRLGLSGLWPSEFDRTLAYLNALQGRSHKDTFWTLSLAADSFGVASELLRRRDELVAAGAHGGETVGETGPIPARIAELRAIEAGIAEDSPVKLGRADRIDAIVRAMASGERPVGLDTLTSLEPRDLLPTGVNRLLVAPLDEHQINCTMRVG